MSTEEDAVEQNHLKALNNKNMWLNKKSQLDIWILNKNEFNMVIWWRIINLNMKFECELVHYSYCSVKCNWSKC